MEELIFPEIFDGSIMGFFTDRRLGVDVSHLTGKKVYFPVQTHSATVKVLKSDADLASDPTRADAVITDRRDIMIGIKTADCVPILLFDRKRKVIGAVHAGWKGTAKGILKKTIKKMTDTYGSDPTDILVAMGPAIRWCCYEVGKDVLEEVKKATGKGEYYARRDGKYCLDLQTANMCQALSAGVERRAIGITEECTYCYPNRFFSYRYSKGTTGRQGGFIAFP